MYICRTSDGSSLGGVFLFRDRREFELKPTKVLGLGTQNFGNAAFNNLVYAILLLLIVGYVGYFLLHQFFGINVVLSIIGGLLVHLFACQFYSLFIRWLQSEMNDYIWITNPFYTGDPEKQGPIFQLLLSNVMFIPNKMNCLSCKAFVS